MTVQWYDADFSLVSWTTIYAEDLSTLTSAEWQSSGDTTITAPAGATQGRVVIQLGSDNTTGRAAFTAIKAGIADKALSEKIDTVQASLGDDIASVEQSLTAEVDAVEGTVSSLYTLRTDVNGRVAGFGLSNDGATSAFGIVADQFYIADPDNSTNEAIPFIYDNGTLYLREALIGSLTFNKLQDDTGTFIVQNGKIQAEYLSVTGLEVEWADIQNVDIGTADIQDAAITSAKIDDLAVTSAKIGDAQVDTLQIAGNAVTIPVSSYTAGNTNISRSKAWTTIQTVVINPLGAPCSITYTALIEAVVSDTSAANLYLDMRILRNGTEIVNFGEIYWNSSGGPGNTGIGEYISGGYFDQSTSSGSRSYEIQARYRGQWDSVSYMRSSMRFAQCTGVRR
jgi:hypothetical protein